MPRRRSDLPGQEKQETGDTGRTEKHRKKQTDNRRDALLCHLHNHGRRRCFA